MNIRKILEQKGISTLELSKKLEKRHQDLQKIVDNPNTSSVRSLRKIADALGCRITDFFDEDRRVCSAMFVCPNCGSEIMIDVNIEKPA